MVRLFIYSILVISPSVLGSRFIFEVPDNERKCFYEEYEGPVPLTFRFKVLRGGQNDVDASIESPNGKILYKEIKKSHDEFIFESSRGVYKYCFGNEFSTFTHKVVYFELEAQEHGSLAVEAGDKRPIVRTAMETSFETIHKSVESMQTYQKEYRLKEAIGRHAGEMLNQRVGIWAIFETLCIVIAGIGQVLILKTFFTEKSSTIPLPTVTLPTAAKP